MPGVETGVTLVTGAGRGIGRVVAALLAVRDAKVFGVAGSEAQVADTGLPYVVADLATREGCENAVAVAEAEEQPGAGDILDCDHGLALRTSRYPGNILIIADSGGIDQQILGLGRNGHIGFNEPTSSLGSRTRVKTLTEETIATNARLFPDVAGQPRLAMTMGIATILDARQAILLATGAAKAGALAAMIEGPVTASCPASALQWHSATTVLADAEAAAQLRLRDYYHWVRGQELRLAGH